VYFLPVLLLMLVLPAFCICTEHFFFHSSEPLMLLIGKWFTFWAAGARLFLAGIKQFFQPRFTAEKIFGITSHDALPFVRELGVANFATGTVGLLSLVKPTFILPIAIAAALFYGIAGIRHATDKSRNPNQNLAMITDLLASMIFIAYISFVVFA
jgi:hypothetical protein